MELAWLTDAASGQPVGVNPDHVVMIRPVDDPGLEGRPTEWPASLAVSARGRRGAGDGRDRGNSTTFHLFWAMRSRAGRSRLTGHDESSLRAIAALVLMGASIVLAAVVAVQTFPNGLTVFACLLLAVLAAWWGLLRHRIERALG